jgi:membrane protein implicated in regulation of membrane protease activity
MHSFFSPIPKMAEIFCREIETLNRPRAISIEPSRIARWLSFLTLNSFLTWLGVSEIAKNGLSISFSTLVALVMLSVVAHTTFYCARRELLDRRLLMNGDSAVGKVLMQEMVGHRTKVSEIQYEFNDRDGNRWHGSGEDTTREYFTGAPIVIIYEPSDPSRNVAVCTTGWRIRTADGYALEP